MLGEADRLYRRMRPDLAEAIEERADVQAEIEQLISVYAGLSTGARRWLCDLLTAVERDYRVHITRTGEMPRVPQLRLVQEAAGSGGSGPAPPLEVRARTSSWVVGRLHPSHGSSSRAGEQ